MSSIITKQELETAYLSAYELLGLNASGDLFMDLDDFESSIAYEGFDVRRVVLAITTAKGYEVKDIYKMIVLFCERGNNIEKMQNKISDTGKKLVKDLMNKYGISKKATTINTITLARVAISYPFLTCQYSLVSSNKIVGKGSLKFDMPEFVKTPAFASLIHDDFKSLTSLHLYYQYKVTEVINKTLAKDPSKALESVIKFQHLATSNSRLTPDTRRSMIIKLLKASDDFKVESSIDVDKQLFLYSIQKFNAATKLIETDSTAVNQNTSETNDVLVKIMDDIKKRKKQEEENQRIAEEEIMNNKTVADKMEEDRLTAISGMRKTPITAYTDGDNYDDYKNYAFSQITNRCLNVKKTIGILNSKLALTDSEIPNMLIFCESDFKTLVASEMTNYISNLNKFMALDNVDVLLSKMAEGYRS